MGDHKWWTLLLMVLVAEARSDNCKIEWIETGHEVASSQYALQLSVVNTSGDSLTYFPNTHYDSQFSFRLFKLHLRSYGNNLIIL